MAGYQLMRKQQDYSLPNFEKCREGRLGVAENRQNFCPIFTPEAREGFALVLAAKYFEETLIDSLACGVGQVIEGGRVDHVTERVFEQALLQIEIAQRTAGVIARSALGKCFSEGRDALNRRFE